MGNSETSVDRSIYQRFSLKDESNGNSTQSKRDNKSEIEKIEKVKMVLNVYDSKDSSTPAFPASLASLRKREFEGGFCLIR